MLGVVYNGTQKFHNYMYGRKFTIECDHEPLTAHLEGPGKEMVLPYALSRLIGADRSELTDGQTGILLQRETEADDVMRELMTLV